MDWPAVQHEVDHLDGVLFLDRLGGQTRERALAEIQQAECCGGVKPIVKESPHSTKSNPGESNPGQSNPGKGC